MPEDWSIEEVSLITQDYFTMLENELQHRQYNKAAHRRALLPRLDGRSEGSIEFKHQNISAVLIELGQPYIKGYKPRYNYQDILIDAVSRYVQQHYEKLNEVFENFALESVSEGPALDIDFAKVRDMPPEVSEEKPKNRPFKAVRINYLQMEQQNRVLGKEGEQFVMDYEKWRLTKAGHPNLAREISWVSKEKGDGLGYDILSKNEDGTHRHIEVKTTKLSKESPFYVSANEVAFATKHPSSFFLYRVFDAASHKKLFIHQGPYADFCRLEPISFRGIF